MAGNEWSPEFLDFQAKREFEAFQKEVANANSAISPHDGGNTAGAAAAPENADSLLQARRAERAAAAQSHATRAKDTEQ